MCAEVKRAGAFGQCAAVDELGASLCQRPFVERWEFFVQLVRENELQHGIAEKFQPLIVRLCPTAFMRNGRMRECDAQQIFVAEFVTETGLQGGEFGHELVWEHRTLNIERRTSIFLADSRSLDVRCWVLGVGCFQFCVIG